jgi:uncharacterized protein (TIGR02265 family)
VEANEAGGDESEVKRSLSCGELYLAKHAFPGENAEVCYPKIGARLAASFFETVLGKPFLIFARVLGPKRMLRRMAINMKNGGNYGEAELFEMSDKQFQLWINVYGDDRFLYIGTLVSGLKLMGAPSARVHVISTDALGTLYSVDL